MIEKNPFKILFLTRHNLIPNSVYQIFVAFVVLLIIVTFAVPDTIIFVNYSILDSSKFIVISLSALTFILSMYSFGREVYSIEDFAKLYLTNKNVYYGYLADYLFPAFLWSLIVILSIIKLIIVIHIPSWFLNLLRIFFISIVMLALISTVILVIHNMNRVSNKVVIKSKEIEESLQD
ncbi:hypothetical protein [Streptococcus pluranimalium]|uniref:hypothetical protein n=1 Tax=Streptococcus pluranimalium TaxID=82348 RepID=UPI003F68FFA2